MKKITLITCLLFFGFNSFGQQDSILMFVSHEQTYYSEYIVMKEALESSGYFVDVRNASGLQTSIYMVPSNATIISTSNSLSGSTYSDFTTQYNDMFGAVWDVGLNSTPQFINVNGRIQDVVNMDPYNALIVVGGLGALDYRYDGTYSSQGSSARLISGLVVENASVKLNNLAIESIINGKPIMAQCHGASLPAFWRVPNTTGPGIELLGYSLLKDHEATGYPVTATPTTLASLGIFHRTNDRVTISSPHSSLNDNGKGDFKILTTRDWYPQTVAYAARSILNILESYPTQPELEDTISILIIHGGEIDSLNCGPFNTQNDVPCNYNGVSNLPADYRHVESLLNASSLNDNFNFNVSNDDITQINSALNLSTEDSILDYLNNYDAVIFFKHWSFFVTEDLQNALVRFTDDGKGVMALHHGLYNDIRPTFNKDILVNELFGLQSHEVGWGADTTTYEMFNTNYGHFISTYGINYSSTALQAPNTWTGNPAISGSNLNNSYYHNFSVFDEIYTNMEFVAGQTFGRNINDITPIFSNNYTPANNLTHTTGIIKQFDKDLNGAVGRVAYYEVGERRESININHLFGQVVRNTVVWIANKELLPDFSPTGDYDGDGILNVNDSDDDNDGILDSLEDANSDADNNPFTNPTDTDGDGLADFLDIDADNDGIIDNVEAQITGAFLTPFGIDTDGDGIDNRYDSDNGGTPIALSNNESVGNPDYIDNDSDGDGLNDWIEGFDDDESGDALNDLIARATAFETATGSPGFYVNGTDTDSDGIPDWLEDDDSDGRPNFLDFGHANYHDSDNDGLIDLYDTDDFGVASILPDGDSDGTPDFRDTDSQTALPIDLLSFDAKFDGKIVNFYWSTASEINNDYFTLEKSKEGINWLEFASQPGAGNSNIVRNYSDVDISPYSGLSYYRLKQTDFNGEYQYSQIVPINIEESKTIIVYPNPINDILTIINLKNLHRVKMYASNGQLIYSGGKSTINTEQWAKGLYQLIIYSETGKIIDSIKVVK